MGALSWLLNIDFAGSGVGAATFQTCWADDEYTLLFGMKKNVASQVVGVQMITAADGSAFTSTVAVVITGDGGTQGASGGTGPTHEGGGCYTYVPTQAETNFDHVCFTFSGTGAISKTVQIYTTFPQTGDNYARIGAPAGASVSADIAAMKVDTAAILVDTGTTLDGKIDVIDGIVDSILVDTAEIGAAGAGLTVLATAANLATVDTVVDAILVDTAEIGAAGAGLTVLATQTSVNTIDDFLDTEIAAIKAKTDQLTFGTANRVDAQVFGVEAGAITASAIAADAIGASELAADAVAEIADAIWDEVKSGHTTAGTYGQHFGSATESATVNDASATTTSFVTTLASAVDDHYIGRVIIFTSGTLQNQATDITDYVGATKTVTVTALTSAPANSVTFVLI